MNTLLPALVLSAAAYLLGVFVHRRAANSPLLHPVVIAMFLVVAVLSALKAFGHPFADVYLEQNELLLECLFVGIVAFALPLVDNARRLTRDLAGILATVVLSGLTLGATTVGLCLVLGFNPDVAAALSLRTVTNPMAVVIAAANGLSVDIAMLGVFITGVVGVIFGERMLNLTGVTDARHAGLMLGITCHTFGIVRALEISPLAAAYATVGMIMTGLLYAFAVPWVLVLAGVAG